MKRIVFLLGICVTLFSCEKEETNSAEWFRLASEKRQEIDNLVAGTACNDINEWSVFSQRRPYACDETHFPIHPSIKGELEKLWAEYIDYDRKRINAMIKEGVIIEPCWDDIWVHTAPLRLECRDRKVSLVYINDLDVEVSKAEIAEIYPRIEAYLAALTCESSEDWTYSYLYDSDCSISYIPVKRTSDRTDIRTDIELYNAHCVNVVNKEKPDCGGRIYEMVESIACEDGKPVVKTREY